MEEMSQKFTAIVTGTFGERGKAWLKQAPRIIRDLTELWGLSDLRPVPNMTYNYVLKGSRCGNQAIVVKVAPCPLVFQSELRALEAFAGHGMVGVLASSDEHQAVLLEQVLPGESLRAFYPKEEVKVMEGYIHTVKQMRGVEGKKESFPHIRQHLGVFNELHFSQIAEPILRQAEELKEELLATATEERLLHGDLHHDNILQSANSWVAIDPKGLLGEEAYELAAFDFIHPIDRESGVCISKLFDKRLRFLAERAEVDEKRLRQWVYVRLAYGAAWCVEDGGSSIINIQLINEIF